MPFNYSLSSSNFFDLGFAGGLVSDLTSGIGEEGTISALGLVRSLTISIAISLIKLDNFTPNLSSSITNSQSVILSIAVMFIPPLLEDVETYEFGQLPLPCLDQPNRNLDANHASR